MDLIRLFLDFKFSSRHAYRSFRLDHHNTACQKYLSFIFEIGENSIALPPVEAAGGFFNEGQILVPATLFGDAIFQSRGGL